MWYPFVYNVIVFVGGNDWAERSEHFIMTHQKKDGTLVNEADAEKLVSTHVVL